MGSVARPATAPWAGPSDGLGLPPLPGSAGRATGGAGVTTATGGGETIGSLAGGGVSSVGTVVDSGTSAIRPATMTRRRCIPRLGAPAGGTSPSSSTDTGKLGGQLKDTLTGSLDKAQLQQAIEVEIAWRVNEDTVERALKLRDQMVDAQVGYARQAEDAEKKKDKNGSTVVAATDQQCTK